MARGDYRFIAAHVERERPAVGEPLFNFVPGFVPGDGADARIGCAF
jgi:hypothetical protein